MEYCTYDEYEYEDYPVVILGAKPVKRTIEEWIIKPYELADQAISITLRCMAKGTKIKEKREYFQHDLLPIIDNLNTNYVICLDAECFKILSGFKKVDGAIGYVANCILPSFEHLNVVYVPNPQAIAFNPAVAQNLSQSMDAMVNHAAGEYTEPGVDVVKFAEYPKTLEDIEEWLIKLLDYPELTMDIEGWSLDVHECRIATICFTWNKHEGISFCVDRDRTPEDAQEVRGMLISFFEQYKGKSIWHNATFDLSVLVYELFMDDLLDQKGLLYGLKVMCNDVEDTKIIAYAALNSTARIKLSLKPLSQEYLGDYAEDVKNIDLISTDTLLEYNLKDGLGTWYVYDKYMPKLIKDEQTRVYEDIFKPAIKDVVQMQLTGLPVDPKMLRRTKKKMQKDFDNAIEGMRKLRVVKEYEQYRREKIANKKNSEYKVKRITPDEVKKEDYKFNPNSNKQLQELMFDLIGLAPVNLTASKQPSTDAKTIKFLLATVTDESTKKLLHHLQDFAAVSTILATFIPQMEKAKLAKDGLKYMFGHFNIGGTISGRLSSSGPNLQNLPSTGSKYAKLIKQCFVAPEGWLFVGIDFWSLEDRISAVTTRDKNKLKVYNDGYDGHSLRAYFYYPEKFPEVDPNSVESINSIKENHEAERQASKPITFALTYQGMWITLHRNLGYSEEKAKLYEKRYHELYKESDEWVQNKLKQATELGYVTVAFGLRVRTPVMHQTILGTKKTPYQAEKEGRSAGNALGQSWGMLNNRAHTAFMLDARAKEKLAMNIRPMMHIHDAQYFLVKDDPDILEWVNRHLVKECSWQEDPEIQHPDVHLGGDVVVYYPSWANEIKLPNHADADELQDVLESGIDKYYETH